MLQTLVERIYEAAFIPEYWEGVIADIVSLSGAASGAMLLVDRNLPPLWSATENIHEQLGAYAKTAGWYNNPRMQRLVRHDHAGFVRDIDVSTADEIKHDSHIAYMAQAGVENQAATGVVMPTGELVMFTVERATGQAHYTADDLARLDGLRPHLARSSLMAARLQLTQAQGTVETLEAVGIPAAVLSPNGVALATNPLFETHADFLRPAAFGHLSVADRLTNGLLQEALLAPRQGHSGARSVPIKPQRPDRSPAVVHVIPLRRAAYDIFAQGGALVVVTSYAVSGMVPNDGVLRGLFDLSAAEAKLATALAAGKTLKEAAGTRSISMPTARSQLAQIFYKTGTHQQSELVALLKSAHPVGGAG